jgi:formylglycine-generating enzyme required for sulfatase activity
MDMAGNVWEWCADWYDASYYGHSPTNNPKGASSGSCRVLRGGSWRHGAVYLRCSRRHWYEPAGRYWGIGFRCGVVGSLEK